MGLVIKLNGEYTCIMPSPVGGSLFPAVSFAASLDPRRVPIWTRPGDGGFHSIKEGENSMLLILECSTLRIAHYGFCYGSYHGNIQLVELDPKTKLRSRPDRVWIVASHSEASDIIFHDGPTI